jgi:YspA, cpYpsA-related SLOG family
VTRILVTGSRHWKNRRFVNTVLDAIGEAYGYGQLVVVHGHCPTGADRFADDWAAANRARGVVVERHPADWTNLGRAAGPVRNEEMVQTHPDLTLAFLTPDSRGTKDCVRRAEREGLRVRRFHSSEVDAGGVSGSV